jgi:hypothetical protein
MRRLSPRAGLAQLLEKCIDEGRLVGFLRLISRRMRQGRAVVTCGVCRGVAQVGWRGFELERHAIPSAKKDVRTWQFIHLHTSMCLFTVCQSLAVSVFSSGFALNTG